MNISFGNKPFFTDKELKKFKMEKMSQKFITPLEMTKDGEIIIHHFWPVNNVKGIEPIKLMDGVDIKNMRFTSDYSIRIVCDNSLNTSMLIFDLEQFDYGSTELFNSIMTNIVKYTDNYPAIGVIEIPAGTKIGDTTIGNVSIVIQGIAKITNIIFGFEKDEKLFKNLIFTGYDQQSIGWIPQVVKTEIFKH